MKKNLLVENIARSASIDEKEAKRAINIILSGIVAGLRQNGQVNLGDFGSFKIFLDNDEIDKAQKISPQKNDKKALRFIPSTKLRQAINKAEEP